MLEWSCLNYTHTFISFGLHQAAAFWTSPLKIPFISWFSPQYPVPLLPLENSDPGNYVSNFDWNCALTIFYWHTFVEILPSHLILKIMFKIKSLKSPSLFRLNLNQSERCSLLWFCMTYIGPLEILDNSPKSGHNK
jgi:hypothetical protein